jgi:tetratricopeptide (TPR) repeat protein
VAGASAVADKAQVGLKLIDHALTTEKDEIARQRLTRFRILLLSSLDRHDEAVKLAGKAYRENPNDLSRVELYVEVLQRARKYAELIPVVDAARERLKDETPISLSLARLEALVHLKRDKEAGEAIAALLAEFPEQRHADVYYMVSGVYAFARRAEEARKLLEKALKADPDHVSSNNDLGYQLADEGVRLDEAEKMIAKALAGSPEEPAYLDSMAWVRYKQGKFKEALEWMNKVLARVDEADAVILDHYGDILYRLGQREKALKQWQAAAKQRKQRDEPTTGTDASTLEAVQKKIDAAEAGKSNIPVAPLGQGVTPPGVQEI